MFVVWLSKHSLFGWFYGTALFCTLILLYFSRTTVNKMLFYRVPIKSQAKEKLFYGNDDKIESWLSKLEYAVSIIMVNLINQQILPEIQTTDYLRLLHFVLIQYSRTKKRESGVNEQV